LSLSCIYIGEMPSRKREPQRGARKLLPGR